MTLAETKNNLIMGINQQNLATLINELAQTIVNNESQAKEIADLKAQLYALQPKADPATP